MATPLSSCACGKCAPPAAPRAHLSGSFTGRRAPCAPQTRAQHVPATPAAHCHKDTRERTHGMCVLATTKADLPPPAPRTHACRCVHMHSRADFASMQTHTAGYLGLPRVIHEDRAQQHEEDDQQVHLLRACPCLHVSAGCRSSSMHANTCSSLPRYTKAHDTNTYVHAQTLSVWSLM